ncbi:MAG: ferritin [Methanomassiliicoccales archaeon]|nr:ferritin [Methanomassiliicoccales archaeon]
MKASIEKALNDQINAELYSAYLYKAMEMYFHSVDLSGMANWMKVQTEEEMAHAEGMIQYINARGGRVILTAIDMPKKDWKSAAEVFSDAYDHEAKVVTVRIHKLVDLAIKEKDHAFNQFLQWYVAEQVEEEDNTSTLTRKLKKIGDNMPALMQVDGQLATRVFVAPAIPGTTVGTP